MINFLIVRSMRSCVMCINIEIGSVIICIVPELTLESERARDPCQSAAMITPVNLSFSFLSPHTVFDYCWQHVSPPWPNLNHSRFQTVDNLSAKPHELVTKIVH